MVNVLIYGAGAIGSLVGYLLSEIGNGQEKAIENVALVGRKSHIKKIRENGLRIKLFDREGSFIFNYCFSSLDDLKSSIYSPDVVVVCVKTYSLARLFQDLIGSGLLSTKLKNADFILLMNGMGNREIFAPTSNHVYEAVTSNGVKFSQDGLIELRGMGETVFENSINPEMKCFMKERFEEKGFEIKFEANFKNYQWNKLSVNSVINPITALTGKQNGIVLSKYLERTIEEIVGECVDLAAEDGCQLDKSSVINLVYSVASKTSLNTSSMLQDLSKGKRTEIDSINGYIIRIARKYSKNAPVNETLYSLVKLIEANNVI